MRMLSDSEIEDRNELSPLRKFRLPFVLGDFVLACKLPFLGLGLGMFIFLQQGRRIFAVDYSTKVRNHLFFLIAVKRDRGLNANVV